MSASTSADCRRNSWLVALAGGVLVALMLALFAGYPVMKAVFIGLVLCVLLGIFLVWAFCSSEEASPVPDRLPDARPAPAPAAQRPAEESRPAAHEGSRLAGHAAPAAPSEPPAFVTAQSGARPSPQAAAPAEPATSDQKPAPGKSRAPGGLDAALAKSKDDPAPAAPEMLTAPRGGKADDLKQIRGIGPKLEALLNEVGVWHFDQIAAWKARDIAHVDERLVGFRGRITRDEWVKQARVLAAGGTTEFSERVKKGGVYREDK